MKARVAFCAQVCVSGPPGLTDGDEVAELAGVTGAAGPLADGLAAGAEDTGAGLPELTAGDPLPEAAAGGLELAELHPLASRAAETMTVPVKLTRAPGPGPP